MFSFLFKKILPRLAQCKYDELEKSLSDLQLRVKAIEEALETDEEAAGRKNCIPEQGTNPITSYPRLRSGYG